MGKRGPQPKLIEGRPIRDSDYYKPSIWFSQSDIEKANEIRDWYNSFTPLERGQLFLLLYELWQEQQIRILDTALEG